MTTEVRRLQVVLNLRRRERLLADGWLGPLTDAALRRLQLDHRLPVTGLPDPATLAALGVRSDANAP